MGHRWKECLQFGEGTEKQKLLIFLCSCLQQTQCLLEFGGFGIPVDATLESTATNAALTLHGDTQVSTPLEEKQLKGLSNQLGISYILYSFLVINHFHPPRAKIPLGVAPVIVTHHNDAIRALLCLKSRATRFFSIAFTNWNKGKHQTSVISGLLWGNTPVTGGFPSQWASREKAVSVLWCHHESKLTENVKKWLWKKWSIYIEVLISKMLPDMLEIIRNLTLFHPLTANALSASLSAGSRNSHRANDVTSVPMVAWQGESPVREPKASWQFRDTTKERSSPLVAVVRVAVVAEIYMMTSSNATFSALLALCTGNSLITSEFPSQTPVMRIFDVFFDRRRK